MNKRKLLLVVTGLLYLLPTLLTAQTQHEQNLKKYWEARDRLKKYFLKIGNEQGNSLPASKRKRDNANNMFWGDGTTYLGWYIAVLATEYKLLKDDGLPTQPTLNELYYAIETVNRLDRTAEIHYAFKIRGDIETSNLNGWLMRDDVPADFYKNWDLNGMYRNESDFYEHDRQATYDGFSPSNEPSQDQMITLMMGFVFVKRYVDNISVQPTSSDAPLNLVTECQEITRRMMGRFQSYKPSNENELDDEGEPNYKNMNYTFGNPVYDWELIDSRDRWQFLMAYPIVRLAQSVTGDNSFEVDATFKTRGNNYVGFDGFDILFNIPLERLEHFYKNQAWANRGRGCLDIGDVILAMLAATGFQNIQMLPLTTLGFDHTSVAASTIALAAWFTADPVNWQKCIPGEDNTGDTNRRMNLRLMLLTSVLSNIHHIDEIRSRADELNLEIFTLMAQLSQGLTISSGDRQHYQEIIDGMPLCDGCYVYSEHENSNVPLSGHGGDYWSFENRWGKHESGFHNFAPSHSYVRNGNFPALDYMIFYNLFHIAFDNELNLPQYNPEVACACPSKKFPEISNGVANPNWHGMTEIVLPVETGNNHDVLLIPYQVWAYQFDYDDIGIPMEKYIIKDLNIQGPGHLKLHESVKACNNAKVYVNNATGTDGKLQVGNTTGTEPSILRFAKGTELHIQGGGILDVYENSKVIIEAGALLRISPGGRIKLNGSNSVLEIRGKLEILPNATFQTEGNGYVLFNITEQPAGIAPYNIAASSTSRMIFQGTNRELKLVVASGTYIYPPHTMQLFKLDNAKVNLQGQKSAIKLGCTFHIVNNEIYSGAKADGITIYSLTQTQYITHNKFFNLKNALKILGFSSRRDLKLHYNEFEQCEIGISLLHNSAHIAGNLFTSCDASVVGGMAEIGYMKLGGRYQGPLRAELNKFENSSGIIVYGSTMPYVTVAGNSFYNSDQSGRPVGLQIENTLSVLKCNYFYRQYEGVGVYTSGDINLSRLKPSINVAQFSGGDNYFHRNNRGVWILDDDASDPTKPLLTYTLSGGHNSFTLNQLPPQTNPRGTSFIVTRKFNYNNYSFDTYGNYELNDNYWYPLATYFGSPTNAFEKNPSPSYHFDIDEGSPVGFVGGIQITPANTCPVAVWEDPILQPGTFDPLTSNGFGMFKSAPDRTFGLDGQGFGTSTTTVGTGTFAGQNIRNAYQTGLTELTTPTESEDGTVYIPSTTGLLNMANLLANTCHYTEPLATDLFRYGYRIYLNTLAAAVDNELFLGNTVAEDAQINAALGVFAAIHSYNNQYQQSIPQRYYTGRYTTEIDKVHVYRVFKLHTDAANVLSLMHSFATTQDDNTVSYLECVTENEKQVLNGSITWPQYEENISACEILYGQPSPMLHDSLSNWNYDSLEVQNQAPETPAYVLSPNPAASSINIALDLPFDADVKISVYNKFGVKVLQDLELGELLEGTHTENISLSGLTADVYNMVVFVEGIPYVQHFIKLNE